MSVLKIFVVLFLVVGSCCAQIQDPRNAGERPPPALVAGSSIFRLGIENWLSINNEVGYSESTSAIGLDNLVRYRNVTAAISEIPLSANQARLRPTLQALPLQANALVARVNLGFSLSELDLEPLLLNTSILADIYMKKIFRWSDPQIRELNPKRTLPIFNITLVLRAGDTGTTRSITEALSSFSEEWATNYGIRDDWPDITKERSIFATSSQRVVETVRTLRFTFGIAGYPSVRDAFDLKLFARMINKSGRQVSVNSGSIAAAIAGATFNGNTVSSIVDSDDPAAWPLMSTTYAMIDMRDTPVHLCDYFAATLQTLGDAHHQAVYASITEGGSFFNQDIQNTVVNLMGNATCDGRPVYNPQYFPFSPAEIRSYSRSPWSESALHVPSSFDPPFYDSLGKTIPSSQEPAYDPPSIDYNGNSSSAASSLSACASLALSLLCVFIIVYVY